MPPHDHHLHQFFGKYGGEVVDIADEDGLGRIRVTVPAVLREEARWARPCVPYGHFVIPPVGAKVWVEFEAGDPSMPIWSGTFYAEGEVPEAARVTPGEAPAVRLIHTPSGHTIELHDTDGDERVVIRHAKDAYASIDKDGSVLLANPNGSNLFLNAVDEQATLFSEQGHLLTLSSDGALLATSDGLAIALKGDQISVAGKKVTLQADSVALTGGAVTLGSSPQMRVMLAEAFSAIFNTHVHGSAMGPTTPPVVPWVPSPATGAAQSVKAGP